MSRYPAVALGLMTVAGVAACGSGNKQTAVAPACEAAQGTLPANATAETWAGTYRLTMVATSGDSAGRSATGQLQLTLMPDSLQNPVIGSAEGGARMPMYGSTDIGLAPIGAVEVGNLTSQDPTAPGVLVLQRPVDAAGGSSTEITVRLGSEANRRGVTRFDGGYTALFVRQASTTGFAGSWASGVTGRKSNGHFCAEKLDG